jgi:hypothetical protein
MCSISPYSFRLVRSSSLLFTGFIRFTLQFPISPRIYLTLESAKFKTCAVCAVVCFDVGWAEKQTAIFGCIIPVRLLNFVVVYVELFRPELPIFLPSFGLSFTTGQHTHAYTLSSVVVLSPSHFLRLVAHKQEKKIQIFSICAFTLVI